MPALSCDSYSTTVTGAHQMVLRSRFDVTAYAAHRFQSSLVTEPKSDGYLVIPARRPSFKELAKNQPEVLVAFVDSGALPLDELTFAAEALGLVANPPLALILSLSHHESPLVREGAVYALAHHVADGQVQMRLKEMASTDSSPGVRESAVEFL